MTYNIKLDYPKEGTHSWNNRKVFLTNQIKFHEPDVMGVQEALPNQMTDIDSLLVAYDFVGVGRDDGQTAGEFSAIFYKRDRLEVLQSSTFWLSETPNKVSMGWDAVCNRVCTYAQFKDHRTKTTFWVFNTHFDHVGKTARWESVLLILNRIKALNTQGDPVILMGDFNLEPETKNIALIGEQLSDAKDIADLSFGPEGTFNGFHFEQPVTRRIDYIFVSENVSVRKYAVLSDNWEMRYPSDHLPVMAVLDIKSD